MATGGGPRGQEMILLESSSLVPDRLVVLSSRRLASSGRRCGLSLDSPAGSASLGRRLPDHLDAVLLQLRPEERVLILQLLDLKNRANERERDLVNNSPIAPPSLKSKLFPFLKTENGSCAPIYTSNPWD